MLTVAVNPEEESKSKIQDVYNVQEDTYKTWKAPGSHHPSSLPLPGSSEKTACKATASVNGPIISASLQNCEDLPRRVQFSDLTQLYWSVLGLPQHNAVKFPVCSHTFIYEHTHTQVRVYRYIQVEIENTDQIKPSTFKKGTEGFSK